MNILILTGRFGAGHIKAAEAIREEIRHTHKSARVNIIDFTEYLFPRVADAIYHGFAFLTSHCGQVYNYFNRVADRYGRAPFPKALMGKIHQLLQSYEPDLIIATLPFCGQYISAYKAQAQVAIPLYTYITDVTLHEEWIAPHTDFYFVAAPETRQALISRGISPRKIILSGIPVGQAFCTPPHRSCDASRPSRCASLSHCTCLSHCARLSHCASRIVATQRRQVLVMGGGLGILSGADEILEALHAMPHVTTTVITGRNTRLAHQLRERFPYFRVLGYVNNVHKYMKEADFLITKPGGITTFEAIAAGTPLLILPPTLAQENANGEFIKRNGIGEVITVDGLRRIIDESNTLSEMRTQMHLLRQKYQSSNPMDYFIMGNEEISSI